MATSPFAVKIKADWQGLLRCIRTDLRVMSYISPKITTF